MKAKKFRKETRVFIYTKNELKDIDEFAEDYSNHQNKELKELLLRANCYNNCGIATVDDDNNCDWCATRNKLLKK